MIRKTLLTSVKTWLAIALAPLHPMFGAADVTTGSAVVTGRIFNPATGEYLRNAEVRAVGGPSVSSEEGGVYRLSGVAPGEVSLVVDFTGYRSATATVRVGRGKR